MRRRNFLKLAGAVPALAAAAPAGRTAVSIRGDQFLLDGKPTISVYWMESSRASANQRR